MKFIILRLFKSIGNNSLEWFCFFVSLISITLVYHHFHQNSKININRVKSFQVYSALPTSTISTTLTSTTTIKTTTPGTTTTTTKQSTTISALTTTKQSTIFTTTTKLTTTGTTKQTSVSGPVNPTGTTNKQDGQKTNGSSVISTASIPPANAMNSKKPLTVYDFDLSLISSSDWKCKNAADEEDEVYLVLLIKSKVADLAKRNAVRETWGLETRLPDVKIRRVFFLGINSNDEKELDALVKEQDQFKDLVTADFKDDLKNSTLKAMIAIGWAKDICPKSQFYVYVEDNDYVSIKNLVDFLKTYSARDEYPKFSQLFLNFSEVNNDIDENKAQPKTRLFGGATRENEIVMRSGSWAVAKEDYPYEHFPIFVSTHAIVMSKELLEEIYIAAHFTRFFWMDDVFLGLCAMRAGIKPVQIPGIGRGSLKSGDLDAFKSIVASQLENYSPDELKKLWNHHKQAGNA